MLEHSAGLRYMPEINKGRTLSALKAAGMLAAQSLQRFYFSCLVPRQLSISP